MVDEGCELEGVGGFGVGGGLVGSGFVAGLGAAGHEAGPAAAGLGAVEGGVEAVEDVGADLLAQVLGYDGAGNKVLVGADLVGQAGDGAVWVALVDRVWRKNSYLHGIRCRYARGGGIGCTD